MNRFVLCLLVGLIVITGLQAQVPIPQTEIAICSYRFNVESKMNSTVLDSDYEDNHRLHKTNPESLALIKSAYDYFTDRITRKTKIDFLPIYEVSPFLELNSNGFPNATLWQAAKRSDFQNYACIDIFVEGKHTDKSIRYPKLPNSSESGKFKHKVITTFPQVRVELILGNEDGKKVAEYSGVYQMTDSIIVETKRFFYINDGGYMKKEVFFNPEKIEFLEMLELAVTDLMAKLEEYSY